VKKSLNFWTCIVRCSGRQTEFGWMICCGGAINAIVLHHFSMKKTFCQDRLWTHRRDTGKPLAFPTGLQRFFLWHDGAHTDYPGMPDYPPEHYGDQFLDLPGPASAVRHQKLHYASAFQHFKTFQSCKKFTQSAR
jgi:hypothetical protein